MSRSAEQSITARVEGDDLYLRGSGASISLQIQTQQIRASASLRIRKLMWQKFEQTMLSSAHSLVLVPLNYGGNMNPLI
ncbi:hypothetical protein ATANTOWER_023938 [Ataeniobius toweri]|uniref:Uncharacterized protein n=1 Tax=Ataeniobius toweri TaxID=208326 RepID=A0ABU7BKH9_9TELE|nr:hypothetical protein [Ataeniobius toweri]